MKQGARQTKRKKKDEKQWLPVESIRAKVNRLQVFPLPAAHSPYATFPSVPTLERSLSFTKWSMMVKEMRFYSKTVYGAK